MFRRSEFLTICSKPVTYSIDPVEESKRHNNMSDQTDRRDANPARVAAFKESIAQAKTEFFISRYGEAQLYLGMLACHPDYQRQGAGEMLCRWGLEKAKAEKLAVTLCASPMGEGLYRRLGFRKVGSFRTQVDGEEEFLETPCMVWEETE
jgi:ribosomal protein S18 acetylase RimI-like enzyme